jgi:large subunit ribosomal protein L18e
MWLVLVNFKIANHSEVLNIPIATTLLTFKNYKFLNLIISGEAMVKRTGPTNPYLKQLIEFLKKKSFELNAPIWKTVAEKLEKPRRQKVEVNLSQIDRYTADGDTVVVPGTVLSSGDINKSVNIAAWRFSATAKVKLEKSKGKCLTIEELVKINPKGTGVKIITG